MSVVPRLLVGAVLNVKDGDHTDSVAEPNFQTVSAPQRFVISSDSSHHSSANVTKAEVDSLVRSSVPVMTAVTTVTSTVDLASIAKEKPVKPSPFFVGSSSAGGTDPATGGFTDLTGSDFLVGGIRTVINPESDLQKTYMVDEFAPPKFFASIHGMEHVKLFTEFNVGAARQMSLSTEVRMRAEYNVKERRRLKSVVKKKDELLKARNEEIENLKAHMLLKEAEAVEVIRLRAEASNFKTVEKSLRNELTSVKSQNDNLVNQVHELEVSYVGLQENLSSYENLTKRLKEFQDAQLKIVNDKFDKLYADFVEMDLHLEEKFYPHLLTTISGHMWLLTHGIELAIINCLHSPEYLSALRAAVGKAIEKGMQDGLSAGIIHGKEGMVLTDVDAHNSFAEADYISALQQLQSVNFSLLSKLKSNKDASIETVMDILRLENALAEKLGLTELQPHVDQLMVPIHHSPDKVVVGASTLSLALDVSSIHVQKIRENIANHKSTLHDVFVPLAEPFSAVVLTGTEDTPNTADATANITTALSTTLASAISVPPISIDDYEVADADGQVVADENVASLPNVDDVDLNIPQ
ncbi:hypothetical protein Tco_1121921 [Tanacetum coccineum]|uniref:Transposase (Putative), gypsy type n=1 Tax=Tanacetum coccineum TaxID=301880 RepID=A0ABQ5IZI3_9ASTR